ncbi:hypothetical protein DFJ63DRAFT_338525 [Scheffersomyces coipomensis]|uniref:uncharacterized protein n=1 Tax=Scheffersomyces coipomensis TaxID=1788519 RepID=UPI00315CC543
MRLIPISTYNALRVIQRQHLIPRYLSTGSRFFQQHQTFKKPRTEEKPIALKYDPSGDGDFLSYGILPFLQGTLNKVLLLQSEIKGARPEHNAVPTSEQRKLLSVLNSNHSLILKGNYEQGKTLGLMTYVLNKALSRVPSYGPLKNVGVESIIILPTDELIEKYQLHFMSLLEGIPEDCCPGELTPRSTEDGNVEYDLSRKPLKIEFLASNKSPQILQTGPTDPNTPPQILITRLSKLEDILDLKYKNAHPATNIRHLKSVEFIAVDEFDYLLKTTGIKSDEIIEPVYPKGKYKNNLELTIRDIQDFAMKSYQDSIKKILSPETVEPNEDEEPFEDQTTFSISDLKHKREDQTKITDENMYKRIEKEAKKLVYKPIQYCFLGHTEHPHKEVLAMKVNLAENGDTTNAYADASNSPTSASIEKLNSGINEQKAKENMKRVTDIHTAFVEKMIRFNDDQRQVRLKERPLISVQETFAWPENGQIPDEESEQRAVNAYFIYGIPNKAEGNKVARSYQICDIDATNLPDNDVNDIMDEHIGFARHFQDSFKENEREFLKFVTASRTEKLGSTHTAQIIAATVKRYRKETGSEDTLCVVVPADSNINGITHKLRVKKKTDRYFLGERFQPLDYKNDLFLKHDDQDVLVERSIPIKRRKINLVVDPTQFLGLEYKGLTDVLVIGLNTLVPQSAFTRVNTQLEKINGVQDAYGDLMPLLVSKFLKSPTFRPKNILFYVGTKKRKNDDLDFKIKRFSMMVAYNRLLDLMNARYLRPDKPVKQRLSVYLNEDSNNILERGIDSNRKVKRTFVYRPWKKRD